MQLSKLKVTLIATTLALSTAFLSQANAFGRDKDKYRQMHAEIAAEWLSAVKQQLQISPEQEPAWDNYQQSLQQQRDAMQQESNEIDYHDLDDMEGEERQSYLRSRMDARLQSISATVQARSELMAVLDDQQLALAEVVLPKEARGGHGYHGGKRHRGKHHHGKWDW